MSEDVLKMEPRLRCTKEKVGLLSKIVHVIKQEPFSASFRLVFLHSWELKKMSMNSISGSKLTKKMSSE